MGKQVAASLKKKKEAEAAGSQRLGEDPGIWRPAGRPKRQAYLENFIQRERY